MPPRTLTLPILSSSAGDASPPSTRYPPQLKPLSLPVKTRPSGIPSHWGDTPSSSVVSPGSSYPNYGANGQYDYRSPSDTADSDRSPYPYSRRYDVTLVGHTGNINPGYGSRDTYESHSSPENETDFQMEETGLRRLHLDDYSPGSTTGQKRRALEDPPREDGPTLHTAGSVGDLYRRRESASRTSPGPPFHSSSASVSSTASVPRTSSYTSTRSLNGSITSVSSYGQLSPGCHSPAATDPGSDAQYVGSFSLDQSLSATSRMIHQRALSETRPLMTSRKLSDPVGHVKHNSAPKLHGVYICECCPKKPKKFDTQAELKYVSL